MSLLIFIAVLVALIWVHELGHFSAAKLFNIRVDEFAIGFPPRLLKVRLGETLYSFNLLLVGGYVKIRGEDPGGDTRDPRSMARKPRALQAAVVAAGVVMNVLFGFLVLSAGYMAGMPASTSQAHAGALHNPQVTIVGVLPDSPAARAGLKGGEVLKAVIAGSGELVPEAGRRGEDAQEFIAAHQNESLIFMIERKGVSESVLVVPEEGVVEGRKAVGIVMDEAGLLRLPPHLALVQGAVMTKDMTVGTAQGLAEFFSALLRGAADFGAVAGPVGIATLGAGAVQSGYAELVYLTALISINLALINLLPIPGLDGGRLVIIAVESIIRRPVNPALVGYLSLAGFALIITLMLVVTYHDITRLVG